MLVRDIMTSSVVTIGMDDTLREAHELLESNGFHHLVVVEEGRIVGIVSDRDILRELSPFVGRMDARERDDQSLERRVHQIMTRNPVCATPEWAASEAVRRLQNGRHSCMPVVDEEKKLVGILTIRDVARLAVMLLEKAA